MVGLPAPLLIHLVVNVEVWPFDKPMPRKIMGGPHDSDTVPDVLNYSWFEYGMRCGMPRFFELFDIQGVPASASMNSAVISNYPKLAERISEAGWEFIGHGVTQKSLPSEDDEYEVISRTLDDIEEFSGQRPRGWLSPGLTESLDTPDHLKRAGIEYVFDWVVDDLPCWMETKYGKLVAMPYSLELNDSLLFAALAYTSDEFTRRVRDTLSVYDFEHSNRPSILTIPLHPHLMGVPHRFAHLKRAIEDLQRRSDTAFVTGATIAEWFLAQSSEGP